MNKKILMGIGGLLLVMAVALHSSEVDFPKLTGPYLGQKPPGTTPEIFAPGILSRFSMLHGKIVFSLEGLEAFWTCNAAPVQSRWTARQIPQGMWTAPEQSFFSIEYIENSMAYSAEGKRLYFHSRRPLQGTGAPKDKDIWYRERTSKGWGDPVPLGPPVNLPSTDESAPSLAADGTLFFSRQESSGAHGTTGHGAGQIDIYYSEWKNGAYFEPVRLGPEINSEHPEIDPVIAPDKSYLLFTSARPDGYSRMMNLYVSFRTAEGRWTPAQSLSHSLKVDNIWFPSLSADGAYLFFCGGYPTAKGYTDSKYYWVNTKIIDQLSPAEGELAYAMTPPDGNAEIFLIHADGIGQTQITNQPGRPYGPAFSPDAKKIAFYNHLTDQTWSLYLMNADGTNIQRLTNTSNALDWSPDWSPDGSRIVFARSDSSPTWRSEIWVMNADGGHPHRMGNVEGQGPDWSPDGSKIAYFNYVEGGGDIWIMNADGTNPIKLTDHPSEDWWPKFSPDGSKIVFQSKRVGNHEIYVMNSDGRHLVRLTADPADDEDPNWSPDGTKIAFISMRDGHYEIYSMNADGSNQTRITTTNGQAIDPDWKPFTIRKPTGKSINAREDDFPKLTGPYLGQKPPGTTPEIFAPGIVSKEGIQGDLFVSPDGSEIIYWERRPDGAMGILSLHSTGGAWSEPTALPFSREYINNEPCLSPDGRKLFFVSNRPRSGAGEAEKRPSIWVSEKRGGLWGEPKRIPAFDEIEIVVQPCAAADGSLYVMGQSGGVRSLYRSSPVEGGFSAPMKVGEKVFSGQISGPCLSPDGRTMILHARREGGFGDWDLCVSSLDPSGNWGELRNLGETINTAAAEGGASFSPDGRYLFFNREGDIYWVSAQAVEDFGPTKTGQGVSR